MHLIVSLIGLGFHISNSTINMTMILANTCTKNRTNDVTAREHYDF